MEKGDPLLDGYFSTDPLPGSPEYDRFGPQPAGRELTFQSAASIPVRAPEWLIEGELPLGGLSLLGGREGSGKSNYWADLAARVTTGRLRSLAGARAVNELTLTVLPVNPSPAKAVHTPQALPCYPVDSVTVLSPPSVHVTSNPLTPNGNGKGVCVIATEDSWESVIVPRLLAAKADLTRIYRVAVKDLDLGIDLTLSLPDDTEALERLVLSNDVALIVLDPLISRLRVGLDTHKDSDVRQALEPLTGLAERTRCTVLGLIHVSKMSTDDPLTSLMGSRAFPAVARSVLYVLEAPGYWDGDRGKRFIGVGKSNYGEANVKMRVFRVQGEYIGPDANGNPVNASRVVWLGKVTESGIRDMLSVINAKGDKEEIMASFKEQLEAVDNPIPRAIRANSAPAVPATLLVPTAAPDPVVEEGASDRHAWTAPDPVVDEVGTPELDMISEGGPTVAQAVAVFDAKAAVSPVEARETPLSTQESSPTSDLDYIKAHWRQLTQAQLFTAFAAANLSGCGVTVDGQMVVSGPKILAAPSDQVNVFRNAIEAFAASANLGAGS